jgi:hypothetical protein
LYYALSYNGNGFDQALYSRLSDDAYEIQKVAFGGAGGARIELSVSGGAAVYVSAVYPALSAVWLAPFHEGITLEHVSIPGETVEIFLFRPYVRILTMQDTVGGTSCVALDDNDPFPHGAFTHALPVETDNFLFTDSNSASATRWGKIDENAEYYAGNYFTRPSSPNGSVVMPVANSIWKGASAWFYYDTTLLELQESASENVTIQDAYKISDVLKVMLPAAGATATHDDGTVYSNFLYAAGTNTIRGTRKVPVIIPITNYLYDYDQPAQKANLRLAELFKLLEYFHNVYPFIAEGILKLEHWRYFDQGRNYTADQVGTDLTTLTDPRTEKPLMHLQDSFRYQKEQLPERIEPGWMLQVSQAFTGYPIDIDSNFVQKGNIKDARIPRFVSDIDYLYVYPQGASLDGFVFLECVEDGGGNLSVPFVEFTVNADEEYRMNNGYASFLWAHDKYHRHGLPAPDVTLNKTAITADSVIRFKVQEISIPGVGDIDEAELIATGLGNARIEEMEESLEHGGLKLTVKLRQF